MKTPHIKFCGSYSNLLGGRFIALNTVEVGKNENKRVKLST